MDQTCLPLRLPQAVITVLSQAHSSRAHSAGGFPPAGTGRALHRVSRSAARSVLPSQGINAAAGGGSFVALCVWFLKKPRLLVPHALAVASRFGPESPFHPKSLSKGELSELVSTNKSILLLFICLWQMLFLFHLPAFLAVLCLRTLPLDFVCNFSPTHR